MWMGSEILGPSMLDSRTFWEHTGVQTGIMQYIDIHTLSNQPRKPQVVMSTTEKRRTELYEGYKGYDL